MHEQANLALLAQFCPGYSVSFLGSLIGFGSANLGTALVLGLPSFEVVGSRLLSFLINLTTMSAAAISHA